MKPTTYNLKTKTFLIKGMHCSSCAMDIDGILEDTDGVISANTSYVKAQTEVEYDQDKISEGKLISLIQEAGYKTDAPGG